MDRHREQTRVWYSRSDLKLAAMRKSSGSSSRFDIPDIILHQGNLHGTHGSSKYSRGKQMESKVKV